MLRENFEQVFRLPPAAVEWLLALYDCIQVLDDVADGDKVERSDLDAAIWNLLFALPASPFFQQNSAMLLPLLAQAILKWQASDAAERAGNHNAMSFAWRAGYYDIVLAVVYICHGAAAAGKAAPFVMALYGEKFDAYLNEFDGGRDA
jgi:hypothetical protein